MVALATGRPGNVYESVTTPTLMAPSLPDIDDGFAAITDAVTDHDLYVDGSDPIKSQHRRVSRSSHA
jgi:hypothetical protein